MDSIEKKDGEQKPESRFNQEIFNKTVRAGKRTYFFDVKSTRNDELYLTITESKKRYEENGRFYFEKHKLFLYKEDFDKFADGLQEVVDYIRSKQPEEDVPAGVETPEEVVNDVIPEKSFSDIEFEDI